MDKAPLFDKDPAVIRDLNLQLLYSPRHKAWFWGRHTAQCKRPVCKTYSCRTIPAKINECCLNCKYVTKEALQREPEAIILRPQGIFYDVNERFFLTSISKTFPPRDGD
jgi:hypothetical protein